MRTHVLPRWGDTPLDKVDDLGLQAWVTQLGRIRSRATVAEALRLTSAVLRSAVRNRLMPFNPAAEVRLPKSRQRDTDDRVISRANLRGRLLPCRSPASPGHRRHCRRDWLAVGRGRRSASRRTRPRRPTARGDPDRGRSRRERYVQAVPQVARRTSRRSPPGWLMPIIREHLDCWPGPASAPLFANEAGAPLRRTVFRSRIGDPRWSALASSEPS